MNLFFGRKKNGFIKRGSRLFDDLPLPECERQKRTTFVKSLANDLLLYFVLISVLGSMGGHEPLFRWEVVHRFIKTGSWVFDDLPGPLTREVLYFYQSTMYLQQSDVVLSYAQVELQELEGCLFVRSLPYIFVRRSNRRRK